MEVAIFFILMLGLLVFILWDRRQPVAPPTRAQMEKGWTPKDLPMMWVSATMSMVCAALGLRHWIEPKTPPFQGRSAIFERFFYEILGPRGPALMWGLLAVFLAASAAGYWRVQRTKQRKSS
jgi:hypothetical protein